MTERIPGWFERALLPRLSEITGEIKAINTRIDALDEKLSTKIEEGDRRLEARIEEADRRLSGKIDSVDEKLSAKIDDLDKRLDIVQRVAVLEAKMGELLPKA